MNKVCWLLVFCVLALNRFLGLELLRFRSIKIWNPNYRLFTLLITETIRVGKHQLLGIWACSYAIIKILVKLVLESIVLRSWLLLRTFIKLRLVLLYQSTFLIDEIHSLLTLRPRKMSLFLLLNFWFFFRWDKLLLLLLLLFGLLLGCLLVEHLLCFLLLVLCLLFLPLDVVKDIGLLLLLSQTPQGELKFVVDIKHSVLLLLLLNFFNPWNLETVLLLTFLLFWFWSLKLTLVSPWMSFFNRTWIKSEAFIGKFLAVEFDLLVSFFSCVSVPGALLLRRCPRALLVRVVLV